MAASEGWYPDPAGRYSHRWWDGQQWTPRVFDRGGVAEDGLDAVPDGNVYCGYCHLEQTDGDWASACPRCAEWLTCAYIAVRPQRDPKNTRVLRDAQTSFDGALAAADAAIAEPDYPAAVAHLDRAIRFGTIVREVAAFAKPKSGEPLARAALVEVHMEAIRVLGKCEGSFHPDAFELELLRRFAAMYSSVRREDLPTDLPALVAWCASRVARAEVEQPAINALLAEYCEGFDWVSIRRALQQERYSFGPSRALGSGDGHGSRREAAEILGVELTADPKEIKKAYYRAAAQFHPDVIGDVPDDLRVQAEEKMKEINAAYEVMTA